MPIYFETADGPQHIPEEIIAQGGAATEAYIAEQGWQPPPPPPAPAAEATDVPSSPVAAHDLQRDEEG